MEEMGVTEALEAGAELEAVQEQLPLVALEEKGALAVVAVAALLPMA